MERARKISTQTLAIAILSVLLVASLLMSATGAWFTSGAGTDHDGYTFGSITLGNIDADESGVFTFDLDETSQDVIMPGDTIDVNFDLINAGTADMFVRFKLVIGGSHSGDVSTAVAHSAPTGWVAGSGDYLNDGYYYRSAALIGDLNGTANESEPVVFSFTIPTSIGDTNEGQTVTFDLVIDAVQVANNGDTNGTDVTYGTPYVNP